MVMSGNVLLYGRFHSNSVVTCVVACMVMCHKNDNVCQKVQYQLGIHGVCLRNEGRCHTPWLHGT